MTALDQYRLTIRNTGTVNTEQLSAITDSTVTIDNAIGLFPALTDTTGSTFNYLNGGTGVFQPPADLLVTALTPRPPPSWLGSPPPSAGK